MDIRAEVDNFLGEKRLLVEAITREFRNGTPAKTIAREVAPAFSRDQVTQYLAAVALCDAAGKALREAELIAVGVNVTGIDAPREARLSLTEDPSGEKDWRSLPGRIRAALRDFHITLALPGAHEVIGNDIVDQHLLGGLPVRLIKVTPRR